MKHFDEIVPNENDKLENISFAMRYNLMTESSEEFLKFLKDGSYSDIDDLEIPEINNNPIVSFSFTTIWMFQFGIE